MNKEKMLLSPIMIGCKMKIKWNSKISGIYAWINDINGKMYIGRSVNLYKRVYDEMNGFVNGKEQNMKKLFNAIKKYGIEKFHVVKVEECLKEHLNDREKFYVKYYDTKNNGYNCTSGGDGTHGHIVSIEQIQRQKESLKKYWSNDKRQEHSEKMKRWFTEKSNTLQEKIRSGNEWWNDDELRKKHLENTRNSLTPDRIKKQRISLLTYYKNNISKKAIVISVTDPNGVINNIQGTYQFCLNNHIGYKNFMRMIRNEIPEYKGWKLASK